MRLAAAVKHNKGAVVTIPAAIRIRLLSIELFNILLAGDAISHQKPSANGSIIRLSTYSPGMDSTATFLRNSP